MDIIEKINILQNKLKLNQKELATLLNISPQAISKILKNEAKPKYDTIIEICKICKKNNISLEWLLLDEDTNISNPEEEALLDAYRHAKPEVQESALLLLKAGRSQSELSCDLKTG